MKTTAILVNASRGALVDSDALAAALKDGQIFAAGLDVVEGEPFVMKDHPLVREPKCVKVFSCEDLILTCLQLCHCPSYW